MVNALGQALIALVIAFKRAPFANHLKSDCATKSPNNRIPNHLNQFTEPNYQPPPNNIWHRQQPTQTNIPQEPQNHTHFAIQPPSSQSSDVLM